MENVSSKTIDAKLYLILKKRDNADSEQWMSMGSAVRYLKQISQQVDFSNVQIGCKKSVVLSNQNQFTMFINWLWQPQANSFRGL